MDEIKVRKDTVLSSSQSEDYNSSPQDTNRDKFVDVVIKDDGKKKNSMRRLFNGVSIDFRIEILRRV